MKVILDWFIEVIINGGFILPLCVLGSVYYILKIIIYLLPLRIMRFFTMLKYGYPPIHCDVDGDFKEEKE